MSSCFSGVLSGQVVRLSLIVENQSARAVSHFAVAASLPDVLIFLNAPREGNVVNLTIPGATGTLDPGKKATLIGVFVAPAVPASYCLKTLLYYETAVTEEEKVTTPAVSHRHHVWRMQQAFEVLPGLTLRGSLLASAAASRDQVIVNLQVAHVNEVSTRRSYDLRESSWPFF